MLCDVCHNKAWIEVTSGDIFKVARTATKTLKLQEMGIDPNMIGAHSLQAGGARALRIMGYKDSTIRKFGRWTSDTWKMYIDIQIVKLLEGVEQKIITPIPYQKITLIYPPQ